MITALLATAPPKVMSKRLFVAIELPDFVRQHCQELITEQLLPLDQNNDFNVELPTTPSSSVKWVLDESMFHCTLQFLGAVDQAKNSDLTQALSQACRRIPPTTLRLGNIGCFPHRNSAKNARVIWLGLESASNNKGELANISRAIMDATEPLGFQREKRSFSAHVTLGRVRSRPMEGKKRRRKWKSKPMDLSTYLQKHLEEAMETKNDNLEVFELRHVALIESILSKQGPSYQTLERFDLLGS